MRPTLILQTVCFDDSDFDSAYRLGARLYNVLTRPAGRPLAHGPGIPVYRAVRPDHVDLDAADRLMILPVLGNQTHLLRRREVVKTLKEWHQRLGDGHVIPVPTVAKWRSEEPDLPGKNLLTQLYGKDDREQRTVDEIVIAALRLFEPLVGKSQLFISHAKADLDATRDAAETIRNYVANDTTAKAFFDVNALASGMSISEQIGKALGNGVFVAIRTDSYSSREWCLHELLQAKKSRLPTLTVELLRDGEALSSPYAGNGPTVVWNDNPQPVVSRALVECLRAAHFRAERERIVLAAGLPGDTVDLCRPPELLDLIQGPVRRGHACVVLHPDPELPTAHRTLLSLAHPKLKLVTPTSAFRRMAGASGPVANPFDGKQIAFSISESPDVDGPGGYAKEHIDDVAVFLARCLIASGAHLAYGGDFRQGGYTEIFSELISAYRQTAGDSDDILHNYLAAVVPLDEAPDNLPIEAHHLDHPPLKSETVLPSPKSPGGANVPKALYFSDMRRVMTAHMLARIILGGRSEPAIEEIEQEGYRGLYPGVVEEAWQGLKFGQPLYVVGGFGGAGGIVAALMANGDTPAEMDDATWLKYPSFAERTAKIIGCPEFGKLDVPAGMEELASSIRALAKPLMKDDESSIRWNGLTLAENRELWRSRDPSRITTLVFQGLRKYWSRRIEGKLEIELVEGSITKAQELDAVAIAVFEGMSLGGAGAALDSLVSGRASLAHAEGQVFVSLDSNEVAADYLYLASLGPLGDLGSLTERIRQAAASTAERALLHGFSRLGVVSFGGGMAADLEEATKAMLTGLEPLSGRAMVAWFENDPARFASLQRILGKDDRVSLSTRRQTGSTVAAPVERAENLVLSVTLTDGVLSATVMPPSGTAVARTASTPFTRQDMLSYSRGVSGRNTPPAADLADRGHKLSKLLFGEDAADLISRCRDTKITLIHDVASSQLPFEILLADTESGAVRPVLDGSINRRLAVSGVSIRQLFAKPPRAGNLRVLVVINPLGDLDGAELEGRAIRSALEGDGMESIEPVVLHGKDATKPAFLEKLAYADVLHYCGHAFFDGAGAEESGLSLYGDPLFFSDLIGRPSPVRFVFANACEAGRVRGNTSPSSEAASFAEYFLRTGVEAYLGTYWKVADTAAAAFAASVYQSLASGSTLDQAVRRGRFELFANSSIEWANYVLYGEGRFHLVRR